MKNKLIVFLLVVVGFCIVFIPFIYFYNKNSTDTVTVSQETPADKTRDELPENQPLYLTTMTHLEEDWDSAATNEIYFDSIASKLRYGMDLAEKYDAILTFESALPFAEGCANFGDNVLLEALNRGHGVGTHIDLSTRIETSEADAIAYAEKRKTAVDNLVGAQNNLGCSGLGGGSDWYAIAKDANCSYMDGIVGIHYLAMPLENRPEGWTDEAILEDGYFHDPAPVGDVRFYPFWISGSNDFVEDTDGDLLLSSGETFDISKWAETGGRNDDPATCGDEDCPFTSDDVLALVNDLKDFDAERDVSKIAKYNIYIPSRLLVAENEEVLTLLFSEMQKLQSAGVIEWASQKSVYDALLAEKTS